MSKVQLQAPTVPLRATNKATQPAKPAEPQPKPGDQVQLSRERQASSSAPAGLLAGLQNNYTIDADGKRGPTQREMDNPTLAESNRQQQDAAETARVSGQDSWKVNDNSVRLNDRQREVANDLGGAYQEATGRKMRITSGERNSSETANELFNDIRAGKSEDMYRNSSSKREYEELRDVYNRANQDANLEGLNQAERDSYVRDQMRRQLDTQTQENRYLSNHQTGRAFDVGTANMNKQDVAEMRRVAESRGMRVKDEGDHLHIDFPEAPVNNPGDTATPQEIQDRDSYRRAYRRLTTDG